MTGQENTAPLSRGGINCLPVFSSALPDGKAVFEGKEKEFPLGGEKEFASLSMAPQKKFQRTFEIVLPNLIHKLRTYLPKKQTVRLKAERKKKI